MAQGLNLDFSNQDTQQYAFGRHPDDAELKSSPNEVKNVLETHVWDDIEQLIEERLERLTDSLIRAEEEKKIRRIQGEIQGWRAVKDLPDILIQYLQQQNENR